MLCLMTLAKNPCQQNSLGCQHICFLSDGNEKCDCNGGYALEQDGKTCTGYCVSLNFLSFALILFILPIISFTYKSKQQQLRQQQRPRRQQQQQQQQQQQEQQLNIVLKRGDYSCHMGLKLSSNGAL